MVRILRRIPIGVLALVPVSMYLGRPTKSGCEHATQICDPIYHQGWGPGPTVALIVIAVLLLVLASALQRTSEAD